MRAEKAWQLRAMPRPRISATSSSALRSCWWLPHWLTTVVYLEVDVQSQLAVHAKPN